MCTQHFLSVCAISAAGRSLAACLSRVSLCSASFALLANTRNCSVRVCEVVVRLLNILVRWVG
jgi:hypothetical protein